MTIIAPCEQYSPDKMPGLLTGDPASEVMLFDVDDDPAEQHNIAGKHPEIVKELQQELDAIRDQFPEGFPQRR